jgi:ribose 5-phosphate isomerase B
MTIAFGSDERTELTVALIDALRRRGHDLILFGAIAGSSDPWPSVGRAVGYEVVRGNADMGIVCCWTGTGVTIASNKVSGVRAALCCDAQTASGARKWNDANVLALSNRATSIPVALEILDAWLTTEPSSDPDDQQAIGDIENVTVLHRIGST